MSKDRRIATNRWHSTMTTSVECRGTTVVTNFSQSLKVLSKSAKDIYPSISFRSSHGGGATDGGGYHPCYYSSQQQFASDYVMSQAGLNGGNLVGGGNGHEVALCTASGCRQTSHNTRQMAPGGVAGTVDYLHNNNSQNQARTLGLLFNSLLKECKNHPN